MSKRVDIETVLRANGLTDEPEKYDGDIHSWRCSEVERYGKCNCFELLLNELEEVTNDR